VRLEFRRYVLDPDPTLQQLGSELDVETDEHERKGMINAFSLPGGVIILLDGLVEAADRDQVFAVLGHELGHITLEHSMQSFYQSAGIAALAGLAWGDFSGVAASVPTALGLLRYGRQLEDEADDFAARFVTIERLDAQSLCGFFELVAELEADEDGDFPEFLSSHPDPAARIARLCPD
jgi:predicted Zn-dependent protease